MKKPSLASPRSERIPLERILPPPRRHYFGKNNLDDLAERMKIHGLVDPIRVRRVKDDYEIVDGLRRWWAAKLLGWRSIDAKIVHA